ncbi:MAG: putative capsid protein [Circoviridae sp.]|nr:MAG: putative capsid protein [Circoviridae sp.]
MPAHKWKGKRTKRKWNKRPFKRSRRLPPLGMPTCKMVRLKYVETISIDPSSGTVGSYYFCANDMRDPNVSGVGHQPLYFDQYMSGYDHFTVLGSKIKVTPTNPTTADIVPVAYGVIVDDNNTFTYQRTEQIIESNQGRRYKVAGAHNAPMTKYSNSITRKFSTKKFFKVKNVVGKAEYKGNTSSSPTEKAFFGVWAGSVGGTDGGNIYLTVEIEYIAMLSEPKYIAQS